MTEEQHYGIQNLCKISGFSQVNGQVIEEASNLIRLLSIEDRLDNLHTPSGKLYLDIDEAIANVKIALDKLQIKLNNYERVDFMLNRKIERTYQSIQEQLSKEDTKCQK